MCVCVRHFLFILFYNLCVSPAWEYEKKEEKGLHTVYKGGNRQPDMLSW